MAPESTDLYETQVLNTKIELDFISFLEEFGLEDFLKKGDLSARLYHDCEVWGEEAENCIFSLRDKFGVDISSFRIDAYFPPQTERRSFWRRKLVQYFPVIRKYLDPEIEYRSLTFADINQAIKTKQLFP